jgi:DNA-binding transcriptional ArsR family regulator
MDEPELSRVARLLADPARARILRTLLDGTMRPAGELAFAAQISAQSASAHLAKLTRGVRPPAIAKATPAQFLHARTCIDLTQRRPHIGGALGAALLQAYLVRGRVQRMPRSRAVGITPRGADAFARAFS